MFKLQKIFLEQNKDVQEHMMFVNGVLYNISISLFMSCLEPPFGCLGRNHSCCRDRAWTTQGIRFRLQGQGWQGRIFIWFYKTL